MIDLQKQEHFNAFNADIKRIKQYQHISSSNTNKKIDFQVKQLQLQLYLNINDCQSTNHINNAIPQKGTFKIGVLTKYNNF